MVYDAGQNSAANQQVIESTALGFVGSLPPSEHPDLMAIEARQFRSVDAARYPGLKAVDTRARGLGAERRVIVTHSPTPHAKQSAGFDQTLTKASRQLDELASRLARGKTRRARPKVEADIASICKDSWTRRVIDTTLVGTTPKETRLTYTINNAARRTLETELFGKRILFTSREDWPVVDVIAAYRSQHHIEADFRQLKDRHVVSFNPMHHWTDQKIRVHVFYCVLALTIAKLMARQANRAGQHHSIRTLLDNLAGIQETVLVYPSTGGRPKARRILTDLNPTQQSLYNLYNLDTYAPKH